MIKMDFASNQLLIRNKLLNCDCMTIIRKILFLERKKLKILYIKKGSEEECQPTLRADRYV